MSKSVRPTFDRCTELIEVSASFVSDVEMAHEAVRIILEVESLTSLRLS